MLFSIDTLKNIYNIYIIINKYWIRIVSLELKPTYLSWGHIEKKTGSLMMSSPGDSPLDGM